MIKEKGRVKRKKKPSKLISPRRNFIFFQLQERQWCLWLVMKPGEVMLLYERDLYILKRGIRSPWSFLSAASSKFLKVS